MTRRRFWVDIAVAPLSDGLPRTVTVMVWEVSAEHALYEVQERLRSLIGDPDEDPGPGKWRR